MRLRTTLIFVGLTILLALLFNLPAALHRYLPHELAVVPAPPVSETARFAVWITLQWIVPALVVVLFLRSARIGERAPRNFSLMLIAVGVVAFFAQLVLRFLASLVPGDELLLVTNLYLSHLFLPTKVILFAGAVWLLTTLQAAPAPAAPAAPSPDRA